MQKRLCAAAVTAALGSVLCAAAPAVNAAEVTAYGTVGTAFEYYSGQSKSAAGTTVRVHGSGMQSPTREDTRIGLKGTEDLGNGVKVGFVLENGFETDTGEFSTGGRLFDREATLSVSTPFGTVYAGRMAPLSSDHGSVGFYLRDVNPFGKGLVVDGSHFYLINNAPDMFDNAVAYVTPTAGGFTGYLQYGMGQNGAENTSSTDRFALIGARYENGPLTIAAVGEYFDRQSAGEMTVGSWSASVPEAMQQIYYGDDARIKETRTLNLGGAYDFGVAKLYASGQIFRNAGNPAGFAELFKMAPDDAELDELKHRIFIGGGAMKGGEIELGLSAPVAGGTVLMTAGMTRAKGDFWAGSQKVRSWGAVAGYDYPLSQRTMLYAAAGIRCITYKLFSDLVPGNTVRARVTDLTAGMIHRF